MVDEPLTLPAPMLAEIIRRLLRVGVPPTAIANAFDMEAGPIKVVARNLRREVYGTDELAEAHTYLNWRSFEELQLILTNGSPELRAKVAMQIQSKAMAITARQTPEEVSLARAEMAMLTEGLDITDDDLEAEAAAYDEIRAQFVPSDDLEE